MPENDLIQDAWYLRHNRDVAEAGVPADTHYETWGWHEGRDPDALFNTSWYLQHNPDVAAAGVDPLWHYDTYGWREGRDPGPGFDSGDYLQRNPDVAAAGMDPLTHYLLWGQAEGRHIDAAGTVIAEPANTIVGTAANDILAGTVGTDRIFGLAGDDGIAAGAGNDMLHGGDGNDALSGGSGDDVLYGGAGNDALTMYDGEGNDVIYGGKGDDLFWFFSTVADNGTVVGAGHETVADFNLAEDTFKLTRNIDESRTFAEYDTNGNGRLDGGDSMIDVKMATLNGHSALSTVLTDPGFGFDLTFWGTTGITAHNYVEFTPE